MSQQVAPQQELTAHDVMRGQVHKIEISDVLPDHISEEKFRRVAMTAVNQNQDLYQCDRGSLLAALLNAATDTQVVYENDEFEYWIDESGPHLRHTPLMGDDRGKATGVYAVCKLKDDSVEIETMSVAQVEEVRAVSRTKGGPWTDWWDEMARKTVVRRLSKRLPMSSDQERVIQRDDSMYDLDKLRADAPERPKIADYKGKAPKQGDDFDKRHKDTIGDGTSPDREPGDESEDEPGDPLPPRPV